jgi:CDP-glucose 4,6-dehydratase
MGIRKCAMEKLVIMNVSFWQGRRVLITGHTGFKGSWLALWLNSLGAKVCGISLPPVSSPNLFELTRLEKIIESHFCDLSNLERLKTLVNSHSPEIVFHLAAQPLVRASYLNPVHTFATNFMGSVNVLETLRNLDSVSVAVFITTDKVYRNLEHHYPYREDDELGGHDPYSASKAASEIVISSYRDSFLKKQGVAIASARAGNVIGGGDWSLDRLIPDAVRVWEAGGVLEIRRPEAIRPWQHVLDPLYGYLTLAEQLSSKPHLAGPYNFGPHSHDAVTVRKIIRLANQVYGKGSVTFSEGNEGPHEAGWLALETSKSREILGLNPKFPLSEAVAKTMNWYRSFHSGIDALKLCHIELEQAQAKE